MAAFLVGSSGLERWRWPRMGLGGAQKETKVRETPRQSWNLPWAGKQGLPAFWWPRSLRRHLSFESFASSFNMEDEGEGEGKTFEGE